MTTNKFRPQGFLKTYIMKQRRLSGRSESYNFQTRIEWFPAGYKANKKTIAKQFMRLHYLACHAPEPVQKKWKAAYKQFENKRFANNGNASIRYLNTWTCHAWL